MVKVVTHLKSLKSLASASLFCGPATIGLELKTLATGFTLPVASVVVCSTVTLSTAFAGPDDLIFTANVAPDRLKWSYEATMPSEAAGTAERTGASWKYTVPGGMSDEI